MLKNKYRLLLILLIAAIAIAATPFIYEFSRKEKHKNVLRSIFSLAYEYKTEKHEWPSGFGFLQSHAGFDQQFIRSNWGDNYDSFDQVLELNPGDAGSILTDKAWRMSVDVNGFVHEN